MGDVAAAHTPIVVRRRRQRQATAAVARRRAVGAAARAPSPPSWSTREGRGGRLTVVAEVAVITGSIPLSHWVDR